MRIPKKRAAGGCHRSRARVSCQARTGIWDWRLVLRNAAFSLPPTLNRRAASALESTKDAMSKRIAALTLICLLLLALPPTPAAHAGPHCFPEAAPAISACIDGPIADFWANN